MEVASFLSIYLEDQSESPLVNAFPVDRVPRTNSSLNGDELTINNSRICGFPGFCQHSAYEECLNTTIISCRKCGISRAVLFMFFVAVLGLSILIGNIIILLVGWHRHKKKTSNKIDLCRNSLAIADLLTAIQILVVVVYNFSWSINCTSRQLDLHQLELRNSAQAYIGGILYLLGFTSSIYHLLYLGLLRLYAIKRPIQYRWLSNMKVKSGLGMVWLFSSVSATVAAWFPKSFALSYDVSVFLFYPSIQVVSLSPDFAPAIAFMTLFLIIPYLLMSVATISSGIMIKCHHRQRARSFHESASSQLPNHMNEQEISVYKTVAIMQIGFTVTLVPVLVVFALFYSRYLDCASFILPFLISIYLSMSNSIVNVIVYSLRDKSFRSSIVEIFRICSIKNKDQPKLQHVNHLRSKLQEESEFSKTAKTKSTSAL